MIKEYFKKIEFSPKFGFNLKYMVYESASFVITLGWGTVYLPAPMWVSKEVRLKYTFPVYGLGYHDSGLWWNWENKSWVFYMPWDWKFYSSDVRNEAGEWVPYISPHNGDDGRYKEVHTFLYKLKNGKIQECQATIYAERREWRWRWLSKLPFPRKVRQSINITFSEEVGEGSGSWKGGVLGCGYDMLPGESMFQTLFRMEKEREL